MNADDQAFIDEGRELAKRKLVDTFDEEQVQMFLGLILDKYEELVSAAVAPQEPKKCTSAYCSQRDDQHVSTCPNWATPQEQRSKVPPIIEHAKAFTKPDDVTQMTVLLMRAWGENDTNSDVSQYPTSYVATFVDMARAALASPVAVDKAKLTEIVRGTIDRRPYADETRRAIRGLEHAVAGEIEWRRSEWLGCGER